MSQNGLKRGIYNQIFSYRQPSAADSAASIWSTPTDQELPPRSPIPGMPTALSTVVHRFLPLPGPLFLEATSPPRSTFALPLDPSFS